MPQASPAGILMLVVVGPTASGKSALALRLAERAGGEIVSFDSMQVYRSLDVGTAKPSLAELARAPHHFISEADPQQPWTAGEYARRARSRIRQIAARGRLPVLVGGTGFYLRALLSGLAPAPGRSEALRERLRGRVARHGPESLHRLLRRLDPEAARRIAPRDAVRAIRALEVRLAAGHPLSEFWRAAPESFPEARPRFLGLDPPRSRLYGRIDARAAAMFRVPGIVEETAVLLDRLDPGLAVWQAHGYKQAVDILCGRVARAAALAEAQREQRQYAKRQMTWFRRQIAPPAAVHWLAGCGDDPVMQLAAWDWWKRALARGTG